MQMTNKVSRCWWWWVSVTVEDPQVIDSTFQVQLEQKSYVVYSLCKLRGLWLRPTCVCFPLYKTSHFIFCIISKNMNAWNGLCDSKKHVSNHPEHPSNTLLNPLKLIFHELAYIVKLQNHSSYSEFNAPRPLEMVNCEMVWNGGSVDEPVQSRLLINVVSWTHSLLTSGMQTSPRPALISKSSPVDQL